MFGGRVTPNAVLRGRRMSETRDAEPRSMGESEGGRMRVTLWLGTELLCRGLRSRRNAKGSTGGGREAAGDVSAWDLKWRPARRSTSKVYLTKQMKRRSARLAESEHSE